MRHYEELFAREKCRIGQVLLTHEDLNNRTRHLNARNTMMNLLRHKIVPVVNENDVVSVDEIKVGDNDVMAALVALLVDADLLVLLTTTDGLREPTASGRTRRIRFLEGVDEAALRLAHGKAGELSTGGMFTKLQAANTAAEAGIATVIASGKKTNILSDIFAGKDVGTLIAVPEEKANALSGRKKWIAFFHRASGTIVVDQGAREALEKRGKSLLPIGIKRVESDFPVGALVNIRDQDNRLFARGLVEYTSEQIRRIMGHKTSEIAGLLGSRDYDEVIHRDNMVLLEQTKGDKR
jgi:glutamate 5-kinase